MLTHAAKTEKRTAQDVIAEILNKIIVPVSAEDAKR